MRSTPSAKTRAVSISSFVGASDVPAARSAALKRVSRSVVFSVRFDDLCQPIGEPGIDHRQLVLPASRFGFGALGLLRLDRCGLLITFQRSLGVENLLDLFVEQSGQSLGLVGAERSRARRADRLLAPARADPAPSVPRLLGTFRISRVAPWRQPWSPELAWRLPARQQSRCPGPRKRRAPLCLLTARQAVGGTARRSPAFPSRCWHSPARSATRRPDREQRVRRGSTAALQQALDSELGTRAVVLAPDPAVQRHAVDRALTDEPADPARDSVDPFSLRRAQ